MGEVYPKEFISTYLMELIGMQVNLDGRLSSNVGPSDVAVIRASADKSKKMRTALQFVKVLPFIISHLPLESVLDCRLINRMSNKYIEKTLEESSADSDLDFVADPFWVDVDGKIPRALRWEIRHKYEVYNRGHLMRFIKYFGIDNNDAYQNNRHPFVSRYLSTRLGVKGVDSKLKGAKALRAMMQRFGQNLTTFCITLDDCVLAKTVPRAMFTLRRIQNVHALRIMGRVPKIEIRYFVKENLAELPYLQFLDLMGLEGIGDTEGVHGRLIIPFLQRYGSQLERLCCSGRQIGYRLIDVPFLNVAMNNLRCLKLEYDDDRRSLIKLAMVKLENLEHLAIQGLNKDGHLNNSYLLGDILRLVNNVAGTLEILEILIAFTCPAAHADTRVNSKWRRQLPNIKKICTLMMHQHEKWFFQFLHDSCRNLEVLEFQIWDSEDWEYDKDKYIFCKWAFQELPNLKKVIYRSICYPDVVYRRPTE